MAMGLLEEKYDSFKIKCQKISGKDEGGIYGATKGDFTKIGASSTNKCGRVKNQFGDFDDSNAVSLLTAEEVRTMIPADHPIIQGTRKLKLPGLTYHESHDDEKIFLIQAFWAEFLCHACTNCLPGIVCERLYQTNSDRLRKMNAPLTGLTASHLEAIAILSTTIGWWFLHTWETIVGNLWGFAKEDATIGQHLPPEREHQYPARYMCMKTFGENKVKKVISALDESPSTEFCTDIAKKIQTAIFGETDVKNLSEKQKKEIFDNLSKEQEKEIRSLFQLVGHGQYWYFPDYIHPILCLLGKAAAQKIAILFAEMLAYPNPANHRLIIEHELVKALEDFAPGWKDQNIQKKYDMGKRIFLWEHINGQYLLVAPSFFLNAAENTNNEAKLNNVDSQAHLLKNLRLAGIITQEHFDRQMALLMSYAMRIDKSDWHVDEDDRNYGGFYMARRLLYPKGYFSGAQKNTRNVFSNVGEWGIKHTVGLAVIKEIGLDCFERIVGKVYRMQTPTPLNPKFVCLGLDGCGCLSKPFDLEKAKVSMVGRDQPHHPFAGQFLCQPCRTTKSFYTKSRKKLEAKNAAEEATGKDLLYLTYLDQKRARENATSLEHYVEFRQGTPREKAQNRATQERINLNQESRQAKAAAATLCDVKNNRKPRSIQKFSKSTEVKYPSDLMDIMKLTVVLFLQQCGQKAMDSKIIYGVLRAVLIEYQNRNPDILVIEYYVEEKGKQRPFYFSVEFQNVLDHYMTKSDKNGTVGKGRFWTAKPNIVSDAQYQKAIIERRQLQDRDFMKRIINQAFLEWGRIRRTRPTGASRPGKKLSECTQTKKGWGRNENLIEYTPGTGIKLSYD